jgi:integrase
MARPIHRLSARGAETVKAKGRYSDGGGLYLIVSDTGAKSWAFFWKRDGRRREVGLGSLRSVSMARARELAAQARSDVAEGLDPKARRGRQRTATFAECASKLLEDIAPGWSNAKHEHQWRRSLTVEAALIRDVPVDQVSVEQVLEVLKPRWLTHPHSSQRLRLRIERTLDFAKARGLRSGENPARWRGHLAYLLPKPDRTHQHHPALDYEQVPAFWAQLSAVDTYGSRALRFIILTAVRSGEALGGRWPEVDFDTATWTVPAERMKGRKAHRVPLSPHALLLLSELRDTRIGEYVFPGLLPGRHLTNNALHNLLLRLGRRDLTTHGFRSSFRDWAGDRGAAREVAEQCLAHTVGNATERAYARGDLFDRRRQLMDSWGAFVTNEPAQVIALPSRLRSPSP